MRLARGDWRPLRLAKDLCLAPKKPGTDPRALSALMLTLRDKSQSVLFATFPGSGWNWTADVLTYATLRHFLGPVEMSYDGQGGLKQREQFPQELVCPADTRARLLKPIRERLPGTTIDYCFHTHGTWGESPLWGLDDAKVVFIVRDVPTALYSFYRKRRQQYETFEACLDETGVLDRAVRFYESWARFRDRRGIRSETWRYEDMLDNPKATFTALVDHIHGQEIERRHIDEAVEYFDFGKRKKQEYTYQSDEVQHFHYRGARDYKDEIAPETLDRISRRMTGVPFWFQSENGT